MVELIKKIQTIRRYILDIKIKHYNDLQVKELYEILAVRNEIFVVEQDCIYQDCDNKDLRAYHLYALENNKIVAYLRILEKGISYEDVSIGRVLVVKRSRGLGYAKIILEAALNFIREGMKEKEVTISAQEYLLTLYKSLGFESVSQVYLEDGIPHIEMKYCDPTLIK